MDQLNHRLGDSELKLSAATQMGPYHAKMGIPNQDAYDLISGEGFLSLAVADGAGSLERSDEGSELAVEVGAGMAADLMLAADREGRKPELPKILAEAILEARSTMFTLNHWREAGSTLVLALLSRDAFAVAVLGDSFAVIQDGAGSLSLVQPPSVGEFANITKLLTSADPTVSISSGPLSELSGLALCSDAFEQPTLENRVPTPGFWSTVFSMGRKGGLKVDELISFMDGQGKIEDDATLIALATELEPSAEAPSGNIEHRDYSLPELFELAGVPNPDIEPQPESTAEAEKPRGLPTGP